MSRDLFTVTSATGQPGDGYASHGRVSREEAIRQARAHFEHQLKQAQTFLETPDNQIKVHVQRGTWRVNILEELKP